ncbi:MAG: MBL fold metallo-hydrolase [Kordiimonas sp.]
MIKTVLTGLFLCTTAMSQISASEELDFLKAVQKRYEASKSFQKYAIHYSYAFERAYQAYDFREPIAGHTVMTAEVDMANQRYFDQATTNWPGGFVFDFIEFSNDTEAMQYDVNGLINGKRVRRLGTDAYENTANYHNAKVDFLAVLPLLSDNLDNNSIEVTADKQSGQKKITHTRPEGSTIYTFTNNPIDLVSIYQSENHTRVEYNQYVTRGNVRFATVLKQVNTETNLQGTFDIAQVREITNISAEKLSLPAGYGPVIERVDRTLFSTEIAPDLYLVTDASAGRNILFKVVTEGIRVFGAPISDKLSEETIALISKQFPNKQILSVYVTHPHHDHIGGLTAYAKRGIPILVDDYSIEAIKAYPKFQKDIGLFTFKAFSHEEKIDGAEFHILENSHAKGQSFVYFPDSQIIYEGDFLEIPYDNSTADHMPEVSKGFTEYIYATEIPVQRIVGHHRNNNISVETMNALYEANTD